MSDAYLGSIMYFPMTNRAITGWHLCDGSLLQITSNQALYTLLGTAFGGDGKATFGLPDLRGRTMIGTTQTTPYTTLYQLGNHGGTETVTLDGNSLPLHNHNVEVTATAGTATTPAGETIGNPAATAGWTYTTATTPVTPASASWIGATGGAGHENMAPFAVAGFYIAISNALYPPRQ